MLVMMVLEWLEVVMLLSGVVILMRVMQVVVVVMIAVLMVKLGLVGQIRIVTKISTHQMYNYSSLLVVKHEGCILCGCQGGLQRPGLQKL